VANSTEGASPDLLRKNTRSYLDRLERERFFGIVAVRYEAGIPVHIRTEQSILPNKLQNGDTINATRNSQ
jgi:hypothetical protein